MNESDIQLKLLSPKPIFIDSIPIFPVSIDSISEYGYQKYSQALSILCISSDQVKKLMSYNIDINEFDDETLVYLFLVENMKHNLDIKTEIIKALSLICRSTVELSEEFGCLIIDNKKISPKIYNSIQSIIKKRNNLETLQEDVENPANEKARQLLEKRKKYREKVKKSSNDSDSDISLGDLVSILASSMHLKIQDVMEYDLYQFNDQFNRLTIFKEYDVNIQALIHGAKSDDIQLQHWLCKTKND